MYLVDASVWVSRFVSADIYHESSSNFLRQLAERGETLVAPAVLLAEVSGAIARHTNSTAPATRATSLIQALPSVRLVPIDFPLAQSGADVAARMRLRWVDALYVALAQRLGIPLVTWDREQLERAREVVTTLIPSELRIE